jgi:hypothetical protein
MDENVHIHKALFMAKGFKQIQGVDSDETFSPVTMLKSTRILLAIAAFMTMRYGKWMSKQLF